MYYKAPMIFETFDAELRDPANHRKEATFYHLGDGVVRLDIQDDLGAAADARECMEATGYPIVFTDQILNQLPLGEWLLTYCESDGEFVTRHFDSQEEAVQWLGVHGLSESDAVELLEIDQDYINYASPPEGPPEADSPWGRNH